MLAELFGMEWWKVHDEAERLEHAVSPDFEAKLLAKLGKGGVCPHGNLSEMESPASRRHRGLLLLADSAPEPPTPSAESTSATAACSSSLKPAAFVPEPNCVSSNATTTRPSPIHRAGNVSLGRAAAERVWVSPADQRPK
jgi:DtxR family Mn-dependent transcriptional regulator